MFAGSTAYDSNWVALRAIRSEWSRTDIDYAGRVDHLRGVGAGLNGGFAFPKQTVFDDQAVDVLIGGSNQDWFVGDFSAPAAVRDQVIDQVIDERISDIDFDLL